MGEEIKKILAIDDNPDNLVTLKALIRELFPSIEILTALDGPTGLTLASSEDPDIVLLDVVMPEMNGFEVCKRMKADPRLSDIPVVFITAQRGNKENRIMALDVGADAFLAKPIDENELTAQIRAMIKIKQANIEKRLEKDRLAELVEEKTIELRRTYIATLNLLEDLNRENEARKKNELALTKSEENLADIFQTVTEGIGYTTLSGDIIAVNDALVRITEIPREELIGKNILELSKKVIKSPSQKDLISALKKIILGKNVENFIIKYHEKILEISATINRKTNRITGVIRDITKSKLAEEDLRRSEEKFRTLVENAFDGIYLTNGKYFYFVNEKFCEIVGYTSKELTSEGFDFDTKVAESNNSSSQERVLLRNIKSKNAAPFEIQIKTKQGNQKIVEVSSVNLSVDDDLNVLGIMRDITERRKIESQIIQTERLSALGEMSAGMAHEINQPLNTLSILFDNILLESKSNQSVSAEYLRNKSQRIYENILRIRNLIDHVRDFSRSHDDYIHNLFNINNSITNALSMVSEQCKMAGIVLETNLDENLPQIKGNTYKFEQVILNLINNAKDALLEKKRILDEPYPMALRISTRFDNKNIYMIVKDNGTGIKQENIDKVLQPFFTTKEPGKGTGLGLSITYGIIQELKGEISIQSKELNGTSIWVTLPIRQ